MWSSGLLLLCIGGHHALYVANLLLVSWRLHGLHVTEAPPCAGAGGDRRERAESEREGGGGGCGMRLHSSSLLWMC